MSSEVASSGRERRIGYRLKCELMLEIGKKSDMWFYEASVRDISLGGVNVYSNTELNADDDVLCNFDLEGKTICVEGVVRHKDYCDVDKYIYTYGIKYNYVGEEEIDILENYLANKHKEIIREYRIW